MITPEDIIIKDVQLTDDEIECCKKIANNTSNTWQKDRDNNEKLLNTIMGKMAEKSLKEYLNSLSDLQVCFCKNKIVGTELFAFYDDFRNDNFKYHNSIDLIFSYNTGLLFLSIKRIREEYQKNTHTYFSLPSEFKENLNKNNVSICEIKSTKITSRHKENGKIDLEKILDDDFLEYPKHTRCSDTIHNLSDYFDYVTKVKNINYEDITSLLADELKEMNDIYFRIYIDFSKDDYSKGKAYIIGMITKEDFKNSACIKKMPQRNKSEKAIYLASKLSNGIPVSKYFQYRIYEKNRIQELLNEEKATI